LGAFVAEKIDSEEEYSLESWKSFCESKVSTAIPGSVEYVKSCRQKGIKVFFITNRKAVVEKSTRENLIAVGLLDAGSKEDTILTKGEKPEWKSNKVNRRLEVSRKYRIFRTSVAPNVGGLLALLGKKQCSNTGNIKSKRIGISPSCTASLVRYHLPRKQAPNLGTY